MSFNIGDRVRITKRFTRADAGRLYWNDRMDMTIGHTGTIVGVHHEGAYFVSFDRPYLNKNGDFDTSESFIIYYWCYSEDALELAGSEIYLLGHGPDNRHLAQELPP